MIEGEGNGTRDRSTVEYARTRIQAALVVLSDLFVPEAKLTFVMRVPGNDDYSMLITDDPDLEALVRVVEKISE